MTARHQTMNALHRSTNDEIATNAGWQLALVSHELRAPLSAMVGWAELLRSGRLGPDEAGAAVDKILQMARHQSGLIEDLLDISRLAAGRLRLNPEPLNLALLMRETTELLRPLADSKRVTLHMILCDREPTANADP